MVGALALKPSGFCKVGVKIAGSAADGNLFHRADTSKYHTPGLEKAAGTCALDCIAETPMLCPAKRSRHFTPPLHKKTEDSKDRFGEPP